MTSCPDFAVLMSVYGRDDATLFDQALCSVYANTQPPVQLILVQDGPLGPDLLAVVDRYRHHPGFTLVELPHNVGLAKALNEGLRHVTSPFVLRADADDVNLPDRFEKQLPLLAAGHDLVGGAIQEVSRDGRPIAIRMPPLEETAILRFARRRNPFNHMTVGFRLDMVLACGGYPDLHLKEDYGLWAAMLARRARVANLPDILVRATTGREMYQRRGGLRYVRSEVSLQRQLVRCGLQTWPSALLTGLMRSTVFLMPAGWRGLIYETLLRRPAKGENS